MSMKRISTTRLIGLGFAAVLVGCTQSRPFDDLWVDHRPYQASHRAAQPPRDAMQNGRLRVHSNSERNPGGTITLHDAVALALAQNPELKAGGWSVAAAEADALQRGRPRNPTVTLGVENFGQPDSLPALPRQTLRISQVIELADKRDKRLKLGKGWRSTKFRVGNFPRQLNFPLLYELQYQIVVQIGAQRKCLGEETLLSTRGRKLLPHAGRAICAQGFPYLGLHMFTFNQTC